MKKCEKCGVPQKDSNFRCIECGAILGDPLSQAEESAMKKKISDFIDDRAARTDPFYVSRLDKITVLLDILGVIASILSMIFVDVVDGDALCLIIMLIFALGGLYTAFPKIGWFFEKLRVEMHYYVENLEPSELYLTTRKVISVATPVLGYMALIYVWIHS